jgi:hypothetical protein
MDAGVLGLILRGRLLKEVDAKATLKRHNLQVFAVSAAAGISLA